MRLPVRQAFVRGLVVGLFVLSSGVTTGGQWGSFAPEPQLAGQTPSPVHGTGLIVGQVVDGTTGRPVGGAIVTLNFVTTGPGITRPGGIGRVLADGEGRFVYHDLPVGSASLSATAPGYTQGSYGARQPNGPSESIVLEDGERFGNATIRVWKLATISGSVADETGDPLVGVTVNLLRYTTDNGTRRTAGGPTATTDDRGIYHFLVASGDYLVVVSATSTSVSASSVVEFEQAMMTPGQNNDLLRNLNSSGAPMPTGSGARIGAMQFQLTGSMSRNAPPTTPDGPLLVYQTTYFPNAFSPSQAQTITLAPGEDRPNVDLTMRLVPTARVAGTVVAPEGPAGNLGLRLVPADSRDSSFNSEAPTARALSDTSGGFTFLGVPAGQYELQVTRMPRSIFMNAGGISGGPTVPAPDTEPTLWARMPVSVEGADVTGLSVVLHPGVRVSGRVEFDGSAPKPAPDRLAAATVILQDLDNQGQPIMPTRLGQDGQFATAGVIPGRYLVIVGGGLGPGWVLKSVMANGHDLSASPQLIETDLPSTIVTFTDHPNQLEGSVELSTAASAGPLLVVYFPSNYQAWLQGGTAGRLSGALHLTSGGHFLLRGLPAGDYDVAALSGDAASDWRDAKMLETIAREATHVSLGDQEHRTVDLKPIEIR